MWPMMTDTVAIWMVLKKHSVRLRIQNIETPSTTESKKENQTSFGAKIL